MGKTRGAGRCVVLALASLAFLAASLPAFAAALSCGTVITETTTLTADIGPCSGDGLVVGADDISLDLGGHRVFGTEGGSGMNPGIRLAGRTGVTVKNGTVSGFDAGVFIARGGTNTITSLTLRDNIGPDSTQSLLGDGVYVLNSPGNRIVDNTLSNNGFYDGIGVYGAQSSANIIEGNLIENTVSDGRRAGEGIIINAYTQLADTPVNDPMGVTVAGNMIVRNVIRGNQFSGIANVNHVQGIIAGNTVADNGYNGIGVQLGPGVPVNGTRMFIQDNHVHGNGANGIHVLPRATGNQLLNNDAANNNARGVVGRHEPLVPQPDEPQVPEGDPRDLIFLESLYTSSDSKFDLHDENLGCAGNVWAGNSWGTGGYSQACVTVGGSGPNPPSLQGGDVAGQVVQHGNNRPIAGATVTAIDADGGQTNVTTAADGTYRIDDLDPGSYTLTASGKGYQPAEQSAMVYADQTTTVDFVLRRGGGGGGSAEPPGLEENSTRRGSGG